MEVGPPRAIGLEVAASDWPIVFMKWETTLEPEGSATIVHQEMNYRLRFGPLGALLDALMMRRKLDASVRAVFANLKRYVEGSSASGSTGAPTLPAPPQHPARPSA